MHGFTPSIPLRTEVGPLQVLKGCGVQVGGGLMAIGPWPRGCRGSAEGSGVIHGTRSRSSGTSAKAIPQAGIPTGLTFGSSSSCGHSGLPWCQNFPEHQSAEAGVSEGDAYWHNNDALGGGLKSRADADGCVDELFQAGVQKN